MSTFANEGFIRDTKFIENTNHKSLETISKILLSNENANNYPLEISYSETIFLEVNTNVEKSGKEHLLTTFLGTLLEGSETLL